MATAEEFLEKYGSTAGTVPTGVPGIFETAGQPSDFSPAPAGRGAKPSIDPFRDIDVETGGPSGLRSRLSLQPDTGAKGAILDKVVGKGKWRLVEGQYVIQQGDKEFLLDERGLSWGDLSDFSGTLPEIAGGVGGAALALALGLNPVTFAGLLAVSALSAFGAQFAGFGAEEISRRAEGIKQPEGVLSRRAAGGALDFTLGITTGGLFNLLKKGAGILSGPFSKSVKSAESQAVKGASERIRAEGFDIKLTPAQETGATSLARVEAIAEKIPGAGEPIKRELAKQDESLRGFQSSITGEPLESAGVGRQMAKELDVARTAKLETAEAARRETDEAIAGGFERARDAVSPVAPGVEASGNLAIEAVRGARDRFKNTVRELYEAVTKEPGGADDFIPTASTKAEARNIIKALPKEKDVAQITDTGILDEFGRPIVREGIKKGGPARAYMPPDVKRFLEGHVRLADTQTISQTIQMRRIVNDAIQQGEGLPGINTRFLRKLSSAITKDIEAGVAAAPNQAIAQKLSAASKHYRENFRKFVEPGVAEFFRDPTQRGAVTGLGIMQKLAEGRGNIEVIRKLKKVLTPDEWGQLRRGVVDYIFEKSDDLLIDGAMNPSKLIAAIEAMSPAMRKEVFGSQLGEVVKLSRALAARYAKIPLNSVDDIGDDILGGLRKAARIEQEAKLEFENQILKPFLLNETGEASINPDQFVRHMMKTGSPVQIKKAMGKFSPELQEKIRLKAVQHVLQDSARSAQPSDVIKELGDLPGMVLSGKKLLIALQKDYGSDVATSTLRLRAIIGNENLRKMKDLGTLAASRERKDEAAGTAGGLVAGSIIANIMRGNISGVTDIAKFRFFSFVMQTKAGRKWLTSGLEVPDLQKTTTAAIVAGPTMARLEEEFRNEPEVLNGIFEYLGLGPSTGESRPSGGEGSAEEFLSRFESAGAEK